MKRIRASQACEGCRAKRTKCDGVSPTCGGCKYREEDCVYDQAPSKRKPPSKRYVQALEARIAALEQHIALSTAELDEDAAGPELQTQCQKSQPTLPNSPCLPASSVPLQTQLQLSSTSSHDVDQLMDMLGSFNLDDGGELRFFGACSNFHLIRDKDTFGDLSSTLARKEGIKAVQETIGNVQTPNYLRDHLLDLFWKWQNSWQYVVPREIFLRDLKAQKSTRFCSPLLLSAIFALASRYSDRLEVRTDPENPNSAGERYAAQARTMLDRECVAPTVSTVQAAALLGLYSSGINQESLGWMYSGMAVRMAFTLGLNLDCSDCVSRGLISADDLECRNVTWWGIFVLDNLFTLGVGRPSTIREQDITARYPSIEHDESTSDNENEYETSYVATTAVYTCRLLQLVRVLDPLYAVNTRWTDVHKKRIVLDTHQKLVLFYDNLPSTLRMLVSQEHVIKPQIYVLHLQFHVSMILLHRPFFPSCMPSPTSSSLVGLESKFHVEACRWSADNICTILQRFHTCYGWRFLPISAVHCAFTAAVIHLLDLMQTDGSIQAKARRRLKICIDAMEEMTLTWAWSGRCLRSIRCLANEWKIDIADLEPHLHDLAGFDDAALGHLPSAIPLVEDGAFEEEPSPEDVRALTEWGFVETELLDSWTFDLSASEPFVSWPLE